MFYATTIAAVKFQQIAEIAIDCLMIRQSTKMSFEIISHLCFYCRTDGNLFFAVDFIETQ
jgi:hypothetical protein